MVVRKRKGAWCVIHCKKKGKIGKPIKCYSIKKYGEKKAHQKALRMHRAIIISKKKHKKTKK